LIEDYSLDGLLMFSSKTCRIMNLAQPDVIDVLDKKYGVPGVIVEGDMIDSAMISDNQIETRLQALYEMIDSRRR
jgi:benzoyl-CoA reductase/2-hydroxyglutaryl-CoA dehydratase subunit BcrC/BadD/HgdB